MPSHATLIRLEILLAAALAALLIASQAGG